jgi:iron complex outermembrane recepter protein
MRSAAVGFARITAMLSVLVVPGIANAQDQQAPAQQPAGTPAVTQAPAAAVGQPEPGTPEATSASPHKKKAEEEIVVTGSRVRRKDLTTPAPVAVISREQIQASGFASVGDFLQQLPSQTGAMGQQVNNGGDGETNVSLRGLGAQRTLVLVDGRRWVNGGAGPVSGSGIAVDLNTIPTQAIERIEILKDGASAMYGSDAIGGVVNIITRKHADYSEASVYAGVSEHGDGVQYDVNATSGVSSDKGGFFITGGYYNQDNVLAGNRSWANTALDYSFAPCGGFFGIPGSSVVPYNNPSATLPQPCTQSYPLGSSRTPAGVVTINPATCTTPLCTALTAKYGPGLSNYTYLPNAPGNVQGWVPYGNADSYNYQAVNNILVPMKRISVFANGDYQLGDYARAYAQVSFTNRTSNNQLASEPFDTTISKTPLEISGQNEFNPFGVDIPAYKMRLIANGPREQGFDLDTIHATAGVDGTLPSSAGPLEGLFWDINFNYGRTSGVTNYQGSLDTADIANAIGPSFQTGDGQWHCGTAASGAIPNCTPINLFQGQAGLTQAGLKSMGAYEGVAQAWDQIIDLNANVNKELFTLFSERPVAIALGYEYRDYYGGFIPDPVAAQGLSLDYNQNLTVGAFYVNEGFAELSIPIVSNVTGFNDLEVDLAGRVSDYNTFGGATTYKIGGRWRPIRDITLRGTYSTGFRAPDISDLYAGTAPSAETAADPCAGVNPAGGPSPISPNSPLGQQCINGPGGKVGPGQVPALNNGGIANQINSTIGGNPKLQPEQAQMATAGIVLEPRFERNLSITVDYWYAFISNTIGVNTTEVILNGCYPASVGQSGPPNAAFCNDITRDPATGQIQNVNDLNANVGWTKTQGMDIAAHYGIPTDFGRFTLNFDSTVLFQYDFQVASGFVYHSAGNYDFGSGSPLGSVTPRFRFIAGVDYHVGPFTATLNGEFIGAFSECSNQFGDSTADTPGYCSNHNIDNAASFTAPANNQVFPNQTVPAYFKMDLFLNYDLKTLIGTTSIGVGIRNLTDVSPPRVYNAFTDYADATYDFMGRFYYARLAQRF